MVSLEPDCSYDSQKGSGVDVQMPRTASQAQKHIDSRFIQNATNNLPALRCEAIDEQPRSIAGQYRIVLWAHVLLTLRSRAKPKSSTFRSHASLQIWTRSIPNSTTHTRRYHKRLRFTRRRHFEGVGILAAGTSLRDNY